MEDPAIQDAINDGCNIIDSMSEETTYNPAYEPGTQYSGAASTQDESTVETPVESLSADPPSPS